MRDAATDGAALPFFCKNIRVCVYNFMSSPKKKKIDHLPIVFPHIGKVFRS